MKNFVGIPQIYNVNDLISCLKQSPKTRMLVYSNDLSDNEYSNGGVATRTDISILLIVENNLNDDLMPIAIIGDSNIRNIWGRCIPEDIKEEMKNAENRKKHTELHWVYDGAFALSTHPDSEM